MAPLKLQYPVTREFTFRYFTHTVLLLEALWLIFITFVNIVAVGYETVSITSTTFNTTSQLWYERFVPAFWLSQSSRSCDGSVIPLSGGLATSNDGYEYSLRAYYDGRKDISIDGMTYEDYLLGDCSVQLIELSQSLWIPATDTEWIACNTSAEQFFEVSTSRSFGSSTSNFAYGYGDGSFSLPTGLDLNITSAIDWWVQVLSVFSDYAASTDAPSLLHPSLIANNLSLLRFGYYDWNLTSIDVLQNKNTPAAEYWTLWLIYAPQNSTPPTEYSIPITFLPTGDIDLTRTQSSELSRANAILAPTIKILQKEIPEFNFWRTVNWIFVSWYWLILRDFGQVAPTVHAYINNSGIVGSPLPIPNAMAPATIYTSTHNIFVNDTLFEIFSSYILDALVPLLTQKFTVGFLPLNDSNKLDPVDTYFLRTYSCLERRWKGPLGATISVLAADYALVFGPYTLIIMIAAWIQKRREKHANHCEGCIEYQSRPTSDETMEPGESEHESIPLNNYETILSRHGTV